MGFVIRPLATDDRPAVREILTACELFSEEEVQVALGLVDTGIAGGLAGPYAIFAADVEGALRGYICIGRTPLTRGTWHLYWIAVHPAFQRGGIGRALQVHAESFIRSLGGERLALETSSRPEYEPTRCFYRNAGYEEVGCIRDFYRPDDDCIMFCKVITTATST